MLDIRRIKFMEIIYKNKETEIIKMIDEEIPLTKYIEIATNKKIKKIKIYQAYEVEK